jgi:hypothetical protein
MAMFCEGNDYEVSPCIILPTSFGMSDCMFTVAVLRVFVPCSLVKVQRRFKHTCLLPPSSEHSISVPDEAAQHTWRQPPWEPQASETVGCLPRHLGWSIFLTLHLNKLHCLPATWGCRNKNLSCQVKKVGDLYSARTMANEHKETPTQVEMQEVKSTTQPWKRVHNSWWSNSTDLGQVIKEAL